MKNRWKSPVVISAIITGLIALFTGIQNLPKPINWIDVVLLILAYIYFVFTAANNPESKSF